MSYIFVIISGAFEVEVETGQRYIYLVYEHVVFAF